MKILKKLAFVLLTALIALHFTSCPTSSKPNQVGNGYAAISFSGANLSRTILPDEGSIIDSFESFRLEFSPTAGYAEHVNYTYDELILKANIEDPISLVPGRYDLVVTAYMNAAGTLPAAETKEAVSIIINENDTTTKEITLVTYSPGDATGDGTYSWDFDFSGISATTYKVEMEIFEDGNTTAIYTIDLLDTDDVAGDWENDFTADISTGKAYLGTGYYEVKFTLEVEDGSWLANNPAWNNLNMENPFVNGKFEFSQALWVYQNLDSEFEFDFTDDSFGPQKVTFKYLDGLQNNTATPDTYGYAVLGKPVDASYFPVDGASNYEKDVYNKTFTDPAPGSTPVRYFFAGWWTRDGSAEGGLPGIDPDEDPYDPSMTAHPTWGNLFTDVPVTVGGVTVDRINIFGDITVYARWVQDGDIELEFEIEPLGGNLIEVTYTVGGAPIDVPIGDKITIAALDDIASITVTNVENSAGDTLLSDIEYYYNNVLIAGASIGGDDDERLVVLTTGRLQPAGSPFIKGFEHIVVIKAKDEENNNASQSFWFILEIEKD